MTRARHPIRTILVRLFCAPAPDLGHRIPRSRNLARLLRSALRAVLVLAVLLIQVRPCPAIVHRLVFKRTSVLKVTVPVLLIGPSVTSEVASRFEKEANAGWKGELQFKDEHDKPWSMKVDVKVSIDCDHLKDKQREMNTIVLMENHPGHSEMINRTFGVFMISDLDETRAVPSHEVGHMIGLPDDPNGRLMDPSGINRTPSPDEIRRAGIIVLTEGDSANPHQGSRLEPPGSGTNVTRKLDEEQAAAAFAPGAKMGSRIDFSTIMTDISITNNQPGSGLNGYPSFKAPAWTMDPGVARVSPRVDRGMRRTAP
jgi:hypothetical protein